MLPRNRSGARDDCDFSSSPAFKVLVRSILGLSILLCATVAVRAQTAVEIDLRRQTASLIKNGQVVMTTPIASGRYGHQADGT